VTRERVPLDEPGIALGSVYDPPDLPYPRLLIMRRWPRGIAKAAVDQWERDLGPSNELLDAYRDGDIDWDAFAGRYREEMAGHEPLVRWAALMAKYTGVTLLCGSHPDEECHRSLLAELIREYLEANPDA
jgi:uncharacterized protein YeaO (DUF488 family)